MNFELAFYLNLGLMILFLVFWITTWCLYAHSHNNPKMSTKFVLMAPEYVDDMHFITHYISELFTNNGVEMTIAAGTALGAARYGHALEHDDDVDVIAKESDKSKIENMLTNDPNIGRERWNSSKFGIQLTIEGKQSYIDIFLVKRNSAGEWRYTGHPDAGVEYLLDADWLNMKDLPYGKTTARQMVDPNPYLTRYYGERWREVAVVAPCHARMGRHKWYEGFNIVNVLKGKMVQMN